MKNIVLLALIIMPCLLIFNESEHIIVNIIGLIYTGFLAYAIRRGEQIKNSEKLKDTKKVN